LLRQPSWFPEPIPGFPIQFLVEVWLLVSSITLLLRGSSMWAWQFAKMQHAADLHGWTRFVSMRNQCDLMQREEERETFGLLADHGSAIFRDSPSPKGFAAAELVNNATSGWPGAGVPVAKEACDRPNRPVDPAAVRATWVYTATAP